MKSAFEQLVARADGLIRAHLRGRILDVLRENRESMTAARIADVLGVSLYPVRQEMTNLLRSGKVGFTHIEVPEGRAYRPVEIGICEWCGLLDHHLIAGECPACAAAVPEGGRPAHARRVC